MGENNHGEKKNLAHFVKTCNHFQRQYKRIRINSCKMKNSSLNIDIIEPFDNSYAKSQFEKHHKSKID